jgi:hypothetical protein
VCNRCSAGPGSTPSPPTNARLVSRNNASASACRPDRYNASINAPANRSRCGNSAASTVNSATTPSSSPRANRTSARSSTAASRVSAKPCRRRSAAGPGSPANASPRHNPSAVAYNSSAAASSPARSADRARSNNLANSTESTLTPSAGSQYPPGPRRMPHPSTRRSRDTYCCTTANPDAGGASSHTPSKIDASDTGAPTFTANSANTACCRAGPRPTSTPSSQARTGPNSSTRNDTAGSRNHLPLESNPPAPTS